MVPVDSSRNPIFLMMIDPALKDCITTELSSWAERSEVEGYAVAFALRCINPIGPDQ
jgi:hypothetical protein